VWCLFAGWSQLVDGVTEIPLPGRPLRFELPTGAEEKLVLREFVAGPENRLVVVAVRSVLNDVSCPYSPVVFYGASGTGKSHLAMGLATLWRACFPKQPVVYATTTDFARQLADAIQTKTADDFGTRYRRAALLVLEQLDQLAGKRATQRELTTTLDRLHQSGGRAVLTTSRAPAELPGIAPSLQTRLVAGLAVPLASPGRDARLIILRRLAKLRHVKLSDQAAGALRDGLSGTVPELLAALGRLETSARADSGLIDLEAARRYLGERHGCRQPSLRDIASGTARQFSLTLGDLRGRSRRRTVATARAVAMYVARNMTDATLQQIGRYFGRRDHTTVAHGCRETEHRLGTNPEVRHAVLELERELKATQIP
jgi:chromosomal replication initiator protein